MQIKAAELSVACLFLLAISAILLPTVDGAAKRLGHDGFTQVQGIKRAPKETNHAKKNLVRSQRVLGKVAREILGPEAIENPVVQFGLGALHSVTSKGTICQ